MKIFSKHRRKLEPYRRYGSKEFKDKLLAAKNYKRNLNPDSESGFFSQFFNKTGFSQIGTYSLLAIIVVVFYFVVLSPVFRVNNISVSGNSQISADQVIAALKENGQDRTLLVPNNDFFILSEGRVNKVLTSSLPIIKEVKTARSWPNKIKIEVTERNPALSMSVSNKDYLIDDEGFVVKELSAPSSQLKVIDAVDDNINTGEIINGKLIPFIISMEKSWPGKVAVPLSFARIPGKGSSEVEFITTEGWSAFFSTDRPVSSQLLNLSLILGKQIPVRDHTRLAYIDLRLAKWAYYCYKQTPCQQTDQDGLAQLDEPTSSTTSGASTNIPESTIKAPTNKDDNTPDSTTTNNAAATKK